MTPIRISKYPPRSLLLLASIAIGISGCGGAHQSAPEPPLPILYSGNRSDAVTPDADWSGELFEREGCLGIELDDSRVVAAVFFTGARGNRQSGSRRAEVRLDKGTPPNQTRARQVEVPTPRRENGLPRSVMLTNVHLDWEPRMDYSLHPLITRVEYAR